MNNKEFGIKLLNYFINNFCEGFNDINLDGERVVTYTFDDEVDIKEVVNKFLEKVG